MKVSENNIPVDIKKTIFYRFGMGAWDIAILKMVNRGRYAFVNINDNTYLTEKYYGSNNIKKTINLALVDYDVYCYNSLEDILNNDNYVSIQ